MLYESNLLDKVKNNDLNSIKAILEEAKDAKILTEVLNYEDMYGWTPLNYAIYVNKQDARDVILEVIIDNGILKSVLNHLDENDFTPLEGVIHKNTAAAIKAIQNKVGVEFELFMKEYEAIKNFGMEYSELPAIKASGIAAEKPAADHMFVAFVARSVIENKSTLHYIYEYAIAKPVNATIGLDISFPNIDGAYSNMVVWSVAHLGTNLMLVYNIGTKQTMNDVLINSMTFLGRELLNKLALERHHNYSKSNNGHKIESASDFVNECAGMVFVETLFAVGGAFASSYYIPVYSKFMPGYTAGSAFTSSTASCLSMHNGSDGSGGWLPSIASGGVGIMIGYQSYNNNTDSVIDKYHKAAKSFLVLNIITAVYELTKNIGEIYIFSTSVYHNILHDNASKGHSSSELGSYSSSIWDDVKAVEIEL